MTAVNCCKCPETSDWPVNWICFPHEDKKYYVCPECSQKLYKEKKIGFIEVVLQNDHN